MKANTVCKYSKCNLGKDGGRKHYYSCGYCVATENWKAMACCKEHYNLYIEEVLAARANGKDVDTLPDRTDMTKDEIKTLKKKPLKKVREETVKELQDYADENGEVNINEVVEKINEELDKCEK
jgi:hypothetical protein